MLHLKQLKGDVKMNIYFENLNPKYSTSIAEFMDKHSFFTNKDGVAINISVTNSSKIKITKNKNNVTFEVNQEHQIFRCLTLLKEHFCEDFFELEEKCYLDTCGIMIDGSQASSLMSVDCLKKFILIAAGMGYNMLMLYCEDCFELEGEPYWGNMRPKYLIKDFQEIDEYADSFGIELIPCIQTLGHLTEAIKKQVYYSISDTPSVLEVGNEKVYALIEKIIVQMSSTFKSRRIHVGLDEAWDLGLGMYLWNNGYRTQDEIMREHTARVYEICEKHGLTPMMWSDMYFRAKSKMKDYYDEAISFTDEDRKSVPENMQLIYWDYYTCDHERYRRMINLHNKISDNIIFAAGARNVTTFGIHLNKTIKTMEAGMAECRKAGVREAFLTIWGDDHKESSNFALLPALMWFAEHSYYDSPDEERIKRRFESCVNADYDDFIQIDRFDCVKALNDDNMNNNNTSKTCMWQDILLGLCDKLFEGIDFDSHYESLEKDMHELAIKYNDYRIMFEFYERVAKVLKTKASLGIKIEDAYKKGNKEELRNFVNNVLPELKDNVSELREYHRRYFFNEYKPIGWEVLDVRYGGLLMRIDTTIMRLTDYIENRIEKIDELEEERLDPQKRIYFNYIDICSASRL